MKRQTRVKRVMLGMVAVALLLATARFAAAQYVTSQNLAQAVEQTLVEAIGTAEKSVVAIARVSKDTPDEVLDLEFRPDAFGRRGPAAATLSPTGPDFVPNDYAAGVVVARRGLILTTYHVLAPNSDYFVTTADRRVYKATIRAADPRSDLAVLAVDATDLAPIEFGSGESLRKGQIVVALGNPQGIARDGQVSATWGIVANLARKAPAEPGSPPGAGKPTIHHYGTLIQTDAKLQMDTSGGALVDLSGRMVGLLTSLPARDGRQRLAAYAIPVDATFRRVVKTLKQGREVEYGFLGVKPANLTRREVLAGQRGMRVDWAIPGPGAPAAAGGLKADDIIIAVAGIPIMDADHLVLEVGRLPVDSVAPITILRRGRRYTLNVRVGKYPVSGPIIATKRPAAWRGLRVDYPTALVDPAYRASVEPAYYEDAVLVREVEQESPAWQAGLRPGMSISHVAGRKVRTPDQFRTTIAGRTGPVTVRMTDQGSPLRTIDPDS